MASFTVSSVLFVLLVVFSGSSNAHLSTDFYSKTCPKVLCTVKPVVQSAIAKERRIGASLLRLHFHDCFVNVRYSLCYSISLLNFEDLLKMTLNPKNPKYLIASVLITLEFFFFFFN